jgi:hypothetical protein
MPVCIMQRGTRFLCSYNPLCVCILNYNKVGSSLPLKSQKSTPAQYIAIFSVITQKGSFTPSLEHSLLSLVSFQAIGIAHSL